MEARLRSIFFTVKLNAVKKFRKQRGYDNEKANGGLDVFGGCSVCREGGVCRGRE